MTFNCPSCGCELNQDENAPLAACPNCGQAFTQPEPATTNNESEPPANSAPLKRPGLSLNMSGALLVRLITLLIILLAVGAVIYFISATPDIKIEAKVHTPSAVEQTSTTEQAPTAEQAPAAEEAPTAEQAPAAEAPANNAEE